MLCRTVLHQDWDPEKHEALMQSQFNENYYSQADPDFAPGGKYFLEGAEDEAGEGYSAVGGWNEEYDEDDDEYHGEGGGQGEAGTGTGRGGWGGEEDDDEEGELGNRELDAELYKLDYEDIVAGIPCRFKYTTVEAEDYGLTIDDILEAKDNELNKYVGLKKISASYRESRKAEGQEMKLSRKRKHLREAIKNRKLEAAEQQRVKEQEEADAAAEKEKQKQTAVPEHDEDEAAKKGKRKRNKKKVIGGNLLATVPAAASSSSSSSSSVKNEKEQAEQQKQKSKKQRRRKDSGSKDVSDKDAAKKRRLELYD